MARSSIANPVDQLQSDSGAVLFSIVQGEQFEYPVTLDFIANASLGYTYECAIIEANNVSGQTEAPTIARPGGMTDELTVFTLLWRGQWSSGAAYSRDDLIYYAGKHYVKDSGNAVITATTPDADPTWIETTPNTIYIRFPEGLSANWSVQPTSKSNVYGFIELRVTEPYGARYQRTWKPLRGMIEFLYSPTKLVN